VWQEIERQFRNDDIVTASVLETTKDGIKVLIHDTMAAFVPGSHIVGTITKDNIGQSVQVKYLNVRKEGIVMSMRRALADLVKVSQGMVLTGKVTSILHFGVVVEILGGVKGFLHISQISNALVKNLENHFQVGQDIKVMVTEVSPDLSKLLFSTRILEKSPGELVECFEELQNSAEERGKAFRDRRQLEKQAQSRVAQDLITFLTSK
jgi:small subunit ribosomal protein S1